MLHEPLQFRHATEACKAPIVCIIEFWLKAHDQWHALAELLPARAQKPVRPSPETCQP